MDITGDTSINIVDGVPGTSVNFGQGDSGAYEFDQPISVNLSKAISGNVIFTGTGDLTFEEGLTVSTANGSITQTSASSTITVNSVSGLSLRRQRHYLERRRHRQRLRHA